MSKKKLSIILVVILALVLSITAITVAAKADDKATLNISVVTNKADNDLVKTLSENYNGITVYSTLDAALADVSANGTKGIMVLADKYPGTATAITAAQASKINELGVRVYVEYPQNNEALGIVGYEGTKAMDYDRAIVIDDDAMGMEMYSLLYVHGAQYATKSDISNSWLVAAKVAGYDTAEYYDEETGELTDCTPYSMLEVNDAGNVLIASTKLSQFINARYAPYARWQSLWMSVISWVAQADRDDINTVEWTPAVNPNYGPDEELADNAYSEAVRLNTEWFINSGLLINADGSEGIKEGYRSGKGFKTDGDQRIRTSVRADCNGETVAALALAAQVLGNEEYGDIAYNIMDWLLNESELANGVRADVENSQYGLLSWHYGAMDDYYGDDNARAILGLIIGASALDTDEFDERILEAIIANFRTTGVYGYRGGMLSAEKIDEFGWEYYYNRTNKNYAPHFESMLWACYLWAYDKTGYEPLLERTSTGISMMMTAYEETMKGDLDNGSGEWKSTNGIQQERAKMILPLAWLVRIDPSEEHIAWLDLMISDMMAYQDEATGALRDAVADEGYGVIGLPPFKTNSDYGGAEAAVIQNNGDPCSDSLYTANFAMLGINEAYAAMASIGNTALASKYQDYATSLSDYHVRIQQVSDNAKYNGLWYRGFDYEKWEAYGSDGDAGWGIWCVETGWTQAWISATLSLQVMETNMWDYSKDSSIGTNFDAVAERMLNVEIPEGEPIPSYELSEAVTVRGTIDLLFNETYGSTTYSDGQWFGAQGVDITLYVDYQREVVFDTVKLHFLQNMSMGICVPAGITVYTSDDGVTYTLFGSAVGTEDIQTEYSNRKTDGAFFEYLTVSSNTKSARYIKIVVENAGEYLASGNSTKHWIFMDELELSGGVADLDALKALIDTVETLDTMAYQPATVLALEVAYDNAVKYYNAQNHDPIKFDTVYDALNTAITGLKPSESYSATSYVNFNKLVGSIGKLTDGNFTNITLQGKVITNLSSLTEQQLEVYLDLGSSVAIHQIGYAADSTPKSGKYLQNAEFLVSDSPDGPWVSVGSLIAQPHKGDYSTTEYRVLGGAANGNAGRYVKVVFTRNPDVEYTTASGKIYRAEWLYLTEIMINEYVPVTVEAENASVTVKGSDGKELSMLGAMVGDDLSVTVTPDEGSMISSVKVNGTDVTLTNNTFVIEDVTEAKTITVALFTFSEEDRPTIVVKDWFITPGQDFDPLADIYAYDKDGNDISSLVTVKESNIGTATGTYTVTYFVQVENGAFAEATANVYVVNSLSGNHVVAITPSTKDDLSKMAQRLVDGTFAPSGSTHAASQYVSWLDNDYVEIVIALDGRIGIADIGYSLISCPTYGFLPPDVDLYVADELGDWTKVATVEAVKHPFANNEYEYIKKYVALDNVQASYVKVVIRFDDNAELLASYGKYVPAWTFVDEIMVNPYYSVSATETENGNVTIATSNQNGVLYGESATVTFTPDAGYVLSGVKINGVAVSVSDNTYTITDIRKHCTVEATFEKIHIRTAAVCLGDSIAILYSAVIDDSSDAQMRFTMNGKTVTVYGAATNAANVYNFKFKDIAPQCMGDNITAELIVGGVVVDVIEEYSIRIYADAMLDAIENKEIEGYTDAQYSALGTLLADMLEYGAAAQKYLKYKVDTLVNHGIEGASSYTELTEECDAVVGDSTSEDVYFTSAGIRFDYVNSMYFKFNTTNVESVSVKITEKATGRSSVYTNADFANVKDNVYVLYSKSVVPQDFGTRYTVDLYDGESVVQTLEYSISAYVYYIQRENTAMAELARTLYNYGISACKFKELT